MTEDSFPKLILPDHFDERTLDEAHLKGYLGGALVELENGNFYRVYFIDPVRLEQDLQAEIKLGRPYIAEAGIVIVPEITINGIRAVLIQLLSERFFDHLAPVMRERDGFQDV